MILPDLDNYPVLKWTGFKWLLDRRVPVETLISLTPIRSIRGVIAHDGRFDEDPEGEMFLAFREVEDVVFWRPGSEQIGTWLGRSFALNEDVITDSSTYLFGNLNIYRSPLDWLRNACDGIVILDWMRAFERLRDCPRIAISEDILFQYQRHMQPLHMPELLVITTGKAVAA
ncbi:hypothetical protein [Mesorhizobium sp. GR13]|uniref:hypothetical protein n=1 Tax=Mesorhizobium sp. GR13 TaxID=2562308 RepID=UPI0010BFDA88|nr:hypothetical protein [Mesorhizobium sp. GR13]